MKLKKVLNNNVLIVTDAFEEEHIVIGRGIAFGQKRDEEIDDSKIERVFSVTKSTQSNRLLQLVREIPETCFDLAEEIIIYAQDVLKQELSDSIYITLTDHIHFVQERSLSGMLPMNPLKWEIQRYYNKEYHIGKKAMELLEEEFDVVLNDDEAASLALHIVNAEMDSSIPNSMEVISLINTIMQIIRYDTKLDFEEDSISYQRLITHLNFFVQRVINRKQNENDNPLYSIVKTNYPKAFACVHKIQEFIEKKYAYLVSKDEITYLTIHIQRLLTREVEN